MEGTPKVTFEAPSSYFEVFGVELSQDHTPRLGVVFRETQKPIKRKRLRTVHLNFVVW